MTPSDVLFYLINSPKAKAIQLTMMHNEENHLIILEDENSTVLALFWYYYTVCSLCKKIRHVVISAAHFPCSNNCV